MRLNPIASRDERLIRLHEAKTTASLVEALFAFVSGEIEHHALFLILRPIEFELPSHCSLPEFQFLCDDYISGSHKDDIWLQRSPVDPRIPVVRHSDYTPTDVFHSSSFYKRVMIPSRSEFGASLVAWKQGTWLANLTLFRTAIQGDFSNADLAILNSCQKHFQSAAIRVAAIREQELGNRSLETFIWSLPTPALVLDWSFRLLHHNALAHELCDLWRLGTRSTKVKRGRRLVVPGDLLKTMEEHRADVEGIGANTPGSPSVIPVLEHSHRSVPGLKAKVSFLPSKSLAISKGTFLIALEHHSPVVESSEVYEKFSKLSRRERDVALLAAQGLDSPTIARQLGTAPITVRMQLHAGYKKLGIKSRHELTSLISNKNLFTAASVPS